MKLHVKVGWLKGAGAAFMSEKYERLISYRNENQFVDIDALGLNSSQLDKLVEQAKTALAKDEAAQGARRLLSKITSYRNISSAPEGKPIGKLENLAIALRAYIEPSPNKWVFCDEDDGYPLPYYVQEIKYRPSEKNYPARVEMRLAAVTRGESDGKSVIFRRDDLGKSVKEILNAKGYYLESEMSVKRYQEDIELYKQYCPLTGSQFRCGGMGFPIAWTGYSSRSMERDGVLAKVVMDDETEEEESSLLSSRRETTNGALTSNAFWVKGPTSDDEEEDDEVQPDTDDVDSVPTPVHPYVKAFDLEGQSFVQIHVRNLTPYKYDKTVEAKLVLPKETKELVNLLVRGSAEILEDIIQGKTGGTIVIATGPPGTGKTLTAEVFSEEIERPLYVVQCSQLGTDEETIEKQLQAALTRASRWGAILLIDEADVYVQIRGAGIKQNAIVGVFLRVLERYRGVVFLTSNRETIIDDAIMSRATAWIRYDYPTKEQLRDLWTILSVQYQMSLSEKAVLELVEKFPKVSGRNIKNLLKLARMLVKGSTSRSLSVDLFDYVSKFLDLSTDEKPSPA